MKISKHENFKEEYSASIVKIGEMLPIEGKDRIVKTFVNGLSMVIGKEEFNTGDVAVYIPIECVIHDLFLHLNNMFDDKELNVDKEKRGYINSKCRVRCVKLGGIPSYGLLVKPESIAVFLNEPIEEIEKFLENHVGEDFDVINGERFVHVYVPPVKENNHVSKGDKRNAKLKRFNMLMEGSFRFHYKTSQFAKEIRQFEPEDVVDISNKLHGTSAIFSNILTNIPTNWFKRMWRKYILHKPEYDQKFNLIYSSRTVIKNQFVNPNQKEGGFYGDDVWGYWAKKLEGLIPYNFTIYGEIVGFTPNGSPIQKGYDYGCKPCESKLMIYRVVENGKELEITPDVIDFGRLLKQHLGDEIINFPLWYHGTLKDLYPELDTTNHWHENVLENMKVDKRFNMEKDEPMCNNKVPVEGIVIRKSNDPVAEAWKLKCDKFRFWEDKLVEQGEVDIEMEEGYTE